MIRLVEKMEGIFYTEFNIKTEVDTERLARQLVEELKINIQNYSEDWLDSFLEVHLEKVEEDVLQEYVDMCGGEFALIVNYYEREKHIPDLNMSKKYILSYLVRYAVVPAIYYNF